MTRLIDADEMLKRLESWNTDDEMDKALYNFTLNRIIEQPTVKAVPVRHGKWIDIDEQTYTWKVRCSCCGHERSMMSTQGNYPNYCEACGARMEEE